MRFLISGYPRCRTAWLTALLCAHGHDTAHDVLQRCLSLNGPYGICDPGVAMICPTAALDASHAVPRIGIMDDDWDDRMAALQKWAGHEIDGTVVSVFKANVNLYLEQCDVVYKREDLEHDEVVAEIVQLATGQPGDYQTIETFQLLHISEHWEKAQALSKPQIQLEIN